MVGEVVVIPPLKVIGLIIIIMKINSYFNNSLYYKTTYYLVYLKK